ncbi:MAG: hypothetical protein JJT94_12955 [Bernardetiaceae bacterium]|nr:hypothetical protein [Bernardetiaceae bacterium]
MKQKYTYCLYIMLCLCISQLNSLSWAQTNQTPFAGTAWTLTEVLKYPKKEGKVQEPLRKTYLKGEQVIHFSKDGRYQAEKFLGLDSIQGALILSKHTLVLSNYEETGYYWVFDIIEKDSSNLLLNFVPYRNENEVLAMRFVPYQVQSADNAPQSTDPKAEDDFVDMEGEWEWGYQNMKVRLVIKQMGNKILANHFLHQDEKPSYQLNGQVQGNFAYLDIFAYGNEEKLLGKARLNKLPEGLLNWAIEPSTNKVENEVKTISGIQLKRKINKSPNP